MEKETKTKRIEIYLREKIKSGQWKRGDILPKSRELAKELNASEFILREAMLPLIREGILGRKPRIGTYVLSEEQVLKGKILLIDISNVQYSSSGFMLPDAVNYEIDLLKEKKIEYKTTFSTNNIPIKEIVKQLQIDNTYFMKGILGVINNISFLPNSVIKTLGLPTISFSPYITNRECEVVSDLGALYYYSLNLLSSFSENIAVIRNDYKVISQLEGEYSKERNNVLERNISKFRSNIIEDVKIDFYKQSFINIYNSFKNMITNNPKIDALFIGDPSFIAPIHQCVKDLGIKVPDELKIVCNSSEYINYGFELKWTRFEFNYKESINKAVNILLKKIKGDNVKEKSIVYPKFIKGNSLFKE